MRVDSLTLSLDSQALCDAFEQLTQPDLPSEEGRGSKNKKLSRSNEGCEVTKVKCPRCRQPWGQV